MSQGLATIEAAGVAIDHNAVLKHLNLDPKAASTQALLLVCDRYGLDPLLKHMVLISGSPYVTRDGLLAVAHRSGQFDGMEVLEQGLDDSHYYAKVAVYRRDMSHPFTYVGRFPKAKQMAKEYGPEMAVKCAEVMALRRAFNVTGIGAAEERWDNEAMPERPAHVDANGEVKSKPKTLKSIKEAITDPTVKLLVEDLRAIKDDDARREAKAEFVKRFGDPKDLKPEQYEEAAAFVASVTF